ncbi:hypothetical protein C5167_023986 [Papaver somniferum]|uniref:Uncharacterized protein n=1 Tax=Papaver somniferum TaxID=3469 RepID=A0A4Y7JRA9_PAPSO|nr:hypothetical protein C5167_023986 [Papaver somniferum]
MFSATQKTVDGPSIKDWRGGRMLHSASFLAALVQQACYRTTTPECPSKGLESSEHLDGAEFAETDKVYAHMTPRYVRLSSSSDNSSFC